MFRSSAAVAWLACVASLAGANESLVLATGQTIEGATLAAYDSAADRQAATLAVEGEEKRFESFIAWGEPREAARRSGLILNDGSRLLSDRAWSPSGLIQIEGDRVKLRRGKGWNEFSREAIDWVLLDADAARRLIESFARGPDQEEGNTDAAILTNGDRVFGSIVGLTGDKLTIDVAGTEVETTLQEVAALRMAAVEPNEGDAACLVGLTDGSLLHADRVRVSEATYELEVAGTTITGESSKLAFLQPLGGGVRYLSDLEPADYRHTPYLDLEWPYAEDRRIRGGQLVGGGKRSAKGLAMHSASRLIYRLDGTPQRFQAELAVADPPSDSSALGSVAFRVYLVKGGAFQAAYESPIVRVGDPAVAIDIEATDAVALALVIDYADNGDAGDEALWLNARLVPTP